MLGLMVRDGAKKRLLTMRRKQRGIELFDYIGLFDRRTTDPHPEEAAARPSRRMI